MTEELNLIKEELKSRGFRVSYEARKFRYSISKIGNPLERLCLQEEGILDRGADGVVEEYNRMINFFREREDFLSHIKGKSLEELTLEEFIKINSQGIEHKAVNDAMNKYWKKLTSIEKNRIRSEYDDIREYVYKKALA